jgi:IS30 family transposase
MKKNNQQTLSYESIYQMIWKDKKAKGTLYEHLRRKGRRYRKRGSSKDSRVKIVGRVGIEKRPKEA